MPKRLNGDSRMTTYHNIGLNIFELFADGALDYHVGRLKVNLTKFREISAAHKLLSQFV